MSLTHPRPRALLAVAALVSWLPAGVSPGAASSVSPRRAQTARALLEREMQAREIPGLQAAVVRRGTLVFEAALGVAELAHRTPVTTATVFSINSITKAFTGVAVMQLAEAGLCDLRAPIGRYLPGLPPAWQGVAVERLLAHSSGLPDVLDPVSEQWLAEGPGPAWDAVQTAPLQFQPGEQFRYNQTNYVLLGRLIEQLSGRPFGEFIAERQFRAVGMPHTGYADFYDVVPHKVTSYTRQRFSAGEWREYPRLSPVREVFPEFLRTASGIDSTARDLARWVSALQESRLVSPAGLQRLWAPVPLSDGRIAGFSELLNGYALGWPRMMRVPHAAAAAVGGGRSALVVYPDDGLAVILLTNRLGATPEAWVDELARLYFDPGTR